MATDKIIERFRACMALKGEDLQVAALQSPAVHFALFTTIQDKDNQTVAPIPNILQLRMSEAYETMKDMGIPVRIICVKPRQVGCSTFAAHIGYHHGQRYMTTGITISDTKEHSKALKEKLAEYTRVDTFPWGNRMVRNPSGFVAWSNGTVWHVDSAENPDAGVGNTYQFFHASECAKWPQTNVKNDMKTMAAVLPALSGRNTVVIAESTPEGAAGWHHDTWQNAITLEELKARREKGFNEEVWVKVFAAWWEFPEYSRDKAVSEAEISEMRNSLTDLERHEIRKYKLSWEQVAWRRQTIKKNCGGQEKTFQFYYPSDDVTCWLASGSPRFDMSVLHDMHAHSIGRAFELGNLVSQDAGSVAFIRDMEGDIQVWEMPEEGRKYLVSIDPATDEDQTIGSNPDRNSVLVWRQGYYCSFREEELPAKLVARVKAPFRANGDKVAGHGVRLSKFYGNAIVCQEVNCGLNILRFLQEAGVPLYKRKPLSHRTGQIVEQYGFKLKSKEDRDAIIDRFATALCDGDVDIPCQHVIEECMKFVRYPSGRAAARVGCFDDDVMSSCMAWEVIPYATAFRKHVLKPTNPKDRGKTGWRQAVRRF